MSISRRKLLKNAAGAALAAAGAGLSGVLDASAQVTGLTPGGGKVPFRLPPGALHDLDRKQYIHNMEIHAHLPGASVAGGEPLMAMWAKGKQRLLPAGGGLVDVSDAKNPVVMKTESKRGRRRGRLQHQAQEVDHDVHRGGAAHIGHTRISVRAVRQGVARQNRQLQGAARHPQLRHHRSRQAESAAGIQYRRKRQRHAHEFLRWRQVRVSRLRLGRTVADGESPAPYQQRHHDRRHVGSRRMCKEVPVGGFPARARGGRRIQEISPSPEIESSWTGESRRAQRPQARRRRRQRRLRRFRRLRHVRDGFDATSPSPSPTAKCSTSSTPSEPSRSTPAIR